MTSEGTIPPDPRGRPWFEALFASHHGPVHAFARRRVFENADDVVAEVFTTAWRRRDVVPDDALPWLYRTASHHVLHARRSSARHGRTIEAIARQPEPEADTADPLAFETHREVRAALASLPEGDQELAAVAIVATTGPVTTPPAATPASTRPSASASTDGTVTLELERLAATVTGPVAADAYLYTRTADRTLGTTCDDRQTETLAPIEFVSPAERERWTAYALSTMLDDARQLLGGYTRTSRGEEYRADDAVPCDRMGTLSHPNPRYVAGFPTTPEGFLAKVNADGAGDAEAAEGADADQIMRILELPWLTDAQGSSLARSDGPRHTPDTCWP